MFSEPLVSVVMPVHNGEKFVTEAIQSILQQTFQNFEFIIVDDGSTDATAQILESLCIADNRISIYRQEKLGFTEALNRACSLAQGKYLARMDADDMSLPQRFSKQVALLEAHPEFSVCGSWVKTFGDGKSQIVRYPTSAEEVKCRLLFECSLAHPSVMMRRELFAVRRLAYNHEFGEASDYRLWAEISQVAALVNIPEVLLLYRIHPGQISERDRQRQQQLAQRIRLLQLQKLNMAADSNEEQVHRAVSTHKFSASREFVERSGNWLLKLETANQKAKYYDVEAFSKVLASYWFSVCSAAVSLGLWTFKRLFQCHLGKRANSSLASRAKMFLRCVASEADHSGLKGSKVN